MNLIRDVPPFASLLAFMAAAVVHAGFREW